MQSVGSLPLSARKFEFHGFLARAPSWAQAMPPAVSAAFMCGNVIAQVQSSEIKEELNTALGRFSDDLISKEEVHTNAEQPPTLAPPPPPLSPPPPPAVHL